MANSMLTKESIASKIDSVYNGQYILRLATKVKGTRDYVVKIECKCCGTVREIGYRHFIQGKTKCRCMKLVSLKKIAKNYARELYVEPEAGLLVGQELTEYIIQCIQYDYQYLKNNEEFRYLVEDELLNLYERKKVKKCIRCNNWYPGSMYKKTSGDICENCRTGALLWT